MIQNSERDNIENEYFEWMCHLVNSNQIYNKVSYKKLLHLLYSIPFYPKMDMDDDRRIDGLDFRKRFAYEYGYSEDTVVLSLAYKECSVLELMISLAFNIEESLMVDCDYGNRTGQWFWNMIVSLDLGNMDDSRIEESYVRFVIDNFNERNYEPNGKGGLFTLLNPTRDLRNVDIWCQCMWYLNEFLGY